MNENAILMTEAWIRVKSEADRKPRIETQMEKTKFEGNGVDQNAKRVKGESMMSTKEYLIRRIRNSAALLYELGEKGQKKNTVDREESSYASCCSCWLRERERERERESHKIGVGLGLLCGGLLGTERERERRVKAKVIW